MQTFTQWHDDNMTFHSETKLTFCRCDADQRLKLSELLALTSDCAIEDYHQRGLTWKVLAEHEFAILVSRLAFRIIEMPKANDTICIHTREESPQGLQLFRSYRITTEERTLVEGLSAWLVVNPQTRRILKPSQFTLRPPLVRADCAVTGLECGKIQPAANMQLLDERTVRSSDIDGNGHVNNSRYGDFIMDSLPAQYRQKRLAGFKLNYAHEAVLGEKLSIFGGSADGEQNADNGKITITGKQQDNTCFESELFWE